MPDKDINTPAEVVQPATETTDKTIGDVLDTPKVVEKPANVVPESAFLKEKMARKDAEKRLKELEAKIGDGATDKEVSTDIASIAKEFDIDPNFLDKFARSIRSETEKEVEDKISQKFKPLEDAKENDRIERIFSAEFNRVIGTMPEFSQVVNPNVIKTLSLLPSNQTKTLSQLIEETYGSAITGKRTIQSTTPGGGKEPQSLDYARAQTDTEYRRNVVFADPKLKAEYNAKMLREGY